MKDLTTGSVTRHIISFSIPMLIGNVFQQLYNVVDSIIVGKYLGKEALASVGASFPIIFTIIALIIGIGSGASVVISQYYGAKDLDKVRRAVDTINIFLLFAGIVISVIGILSSRWIFGLLQLPPELMDSALTYLNTYLLGMVVFFGFNATSSILRGIGDSKTPLYYLIIATVVNIFLDLLFVLVFNWGIAGAAWATVISQAGAFATAIVHLNRKNQVVRFALKGLTFDREIFRQIVRIGLPTGIQHTFVALGMMALMGIVNSFGTNVIAAFTAASRIDSLASLPAMTLSVALSVFVGQNLGAGKLERIKSGLKTSLIFASSISVLMSLVAIFWSVPLMKIFTNDANVITIGREYLIIVSVFYLLFSTMFVLNGLLRGAGATLIPMFVTLFSLWLVRIPLAWLLSRYMGESGIWWSIPIAWCFGVTGAYFYYRFGKWKTKGVIKHQQ
ncbi:MAG TPA: MATE family efflux transporter [Tenuifilaceae bacterium]|nr:MATE family efflux transporter [Tenuifilaceae bacterium]